MPGDSDHILPPRYSDVEPIAAGGMGEIYRATDNELRRQVVVKVLAERYARDDALRQRFKREALAAARLSGAPNIVTIFDVGEHRERPFIVMEYLAGGSLHDRAHGRTPFPPAQALDWLEEAAHALDAAHEAGVVHRDVKPGNLLLDERDHVRVADFGIASAAGLDSFTKPGTVMGTAGYLAPEQARGERATAASDRYALGVVGFELLTGRRPYEAESPTAEAAAHIHAEIPAASAVNGALPRELDDVFRQGLAKDPAGRYPTAADFVADLRHALHEAAGSTMIAEPPAAAPAPPLPPRPPVRRTRWLVPVLLGILVLGGFLVAFLALRDDGDGVATTRAAPRPRTVVRTVTQEGTTVEKTVTAEPPPPPTTEPAPVTTATGGGSNQSGAALNDAGYRKMQAGDYEGALPLLERAVQRLAGTGSTTEAYADYNLAYTRFALGRCDGVLDLLVTSEQLQGHRSEIDALRARAQETCA